MPGPTSFDKKVYAAIQETDRLPDEFKTWLPRFLRYQSQMQLSKQQLPGVMGEVFKNVGDVGNPAFTSPWRSFQAGASAYGKVRFYKDYMGIVHLDGLAETTGTPGTSIIFTLPAGYRPTQVQRVITEGWNGAYVFPTLDILATGDISIINPAPSSFTNGTHISLANIHFRAG